jgi:hypothetical protein
VTVPAGASCYLDGVRVTDNVTVGTGATLEVANTTGDSTIGGNVTGKDCGSIDLESTGGSNRVAVGGNLTVTSCNGGFDGARGNSAQPPIPPQTMLIGGNVKCDGNPGGCVFDYTVLGKNLECSGNFNCDLESNAIGGSVTLKGNSGTGIRVDNNIVGGNLACSGNVATTGGGNTVAGTKSGQCSGFEGGSEATREGAAKERRPPRRGARKKKPLDAHFLFAYPLIGPRPTE